jgi:hypothetical protein
MTSLPASVSPAGPEAADGPETPADPETSGRAESGGAEGGGAEGGGIESAVAVGERATTDDTRRKDRI